MRHEGGGLSVELDLDQLGVVGSKDIIIFARDDGGPSNRIVAREDGDPILVPDLVLAPAGVDDIEAVSHPADSDGLGVEKLRQLADLVVLDLERDALEDDLVDAAFRRVGLGGEASGDGAVDGTPVEVVG
jgi:hypothetical protein